MISLFFVGTLMLTACGGSDGGDDEKPTADTTKPTVSFTIPANEEAFVMGTNVKFKGSFTDDTELASVMFSLASQKPPLAYGSAGLDDPSWEPADVTVTLSGKAQSLDQNIFEVIPNDVYTGFYTLTVTVKDKAGNFDSKTVDIDIN